jgi:hypothetical protein
MQVGGADIGVNEDNPLPHLPQHDPEIGHKTAFTNAAFAAGNGDNEFFAPEHYRKVFPIQDNCLK